MWLLATSPEGKFQALVTLILGVLGILSILGGIAWRAIRWIRQQTDAIQDNTRKTAELAAAVDRLSGMIDRARPQQPRRRRWGR